MDIGYARLEVPCKKFVTKIAMDNFCAISVPDISSQNWHKPSLNDAKRHAVLPPDGLPRIGLGLIIGYVQNSNDNGLPGF